MNGKTEQVSIKTFWPIFWSYLFIINSISCVFYTIRVFEKWFNVPYSNSLLFITIIYSISIYLSFSVAIISLTAWNKKGYKNLDKIKNHGIIWYLEKYFIWILIISVLMSIIIAGLVEIFYFTTISNLIILSSSILRYLVPGFMFIGFTTGSILGIIYEFKKEIK